MPQHFYVERGYQDDHQYTGDDEEEDGIFVKGGPGGHIFRESSERGTQRQSNKYYKNSNSVGPAETLSMG